LPVGGDSGKLDLKRLEEEERTFSFLRVPSFLLFVPNIVSQVILLYPAVVVPSDSNRQL
jgi:hypothetical protein